MYLFKHHHSQVFAAIYEWREGKRPVKVVKSKSTPKLKSSDRFDGDLYKTVFDRHVETLEGLLKKYPDIYHTVMAKLYSMVT